jgi:hypothetical protein
MVTAHSSQLGLVRDTEDAEESFFMENREMSILHKLQAFGQKVPREGLKPFCLFR